MTPGDPEELRPTQLVERTRAAIYHALVPADPLADVYHDPITAALMGHYFTALGPAIGRYREPADQDRFTREEAARFLAMFAQAEQRAGRTSRRALFALGPAARGRRWAISSN